jgi:hypothetical protein
VEKIDNTFIRTHSTLFEDFWNRQLGDSFFETGYPAYGYTVNLTTNANEVLEAAQLSAPRYCRSAPPAGNSHIELHVRVVPGWAATPAPSLLPALIQTASMGDLLFQAATPWVQWFADLKGRVSYGFISRGLAAEPRLVSRYLLDRATNNMLLREGVGQLHATSLVRDDRVLVFIAPHGTGKSTTAFQLLAAGYRLLGDGLLFVREREGRFELLGYPVGEGKLTPAMQAIFPEWRGEGDEVTEQNRQKSIVNLRRLAPDKIVEQAVMAERVMVFLAERYGSSETSAMPVTPDEAFARVLPDTLHLDKVEAMVRSLTQVRHMLESSTCYRLSLGADPDQLVRAIVDLAGG